MGSRQGDMEIMQCINGRRGPRWGGGGGRGGTAGVVSIGGGKLGGPEDVCDALPVQIVRPGRARPLRQQVALVQQQQAGLGVVDVPGVVLQVCAAVRQRVPRIYHLCPRNERGTSGDGIISTNLRYL